MGDPERPLRPPGGRALREGLRADGRQLAPAHAAVDRARRRGGLGEDRRRPHQRHEDPGRHREPGRRPAQSQEARRLEATGPKDVKGEDVPETGVEVLNPEVQLFTLEAGAKVTLELGVGIGRGYEAADHPRSGMPSGAFALDAAFSPITKVTYNVEMSRLGKITDYEKLIVEVWTNGAVSPDDALTRAATFLRDHFSPLSPGGSDEDEEAEAGAGDAYLREALGKTLEELALPARAINALKGAELHLVADLVQKTEGDLADVKNLGDKSIDEIKTALAALGLSLGMRIDPNVLGALGRGTTTGTPAGGLR
ncbi:MAG: hypothetical protein DMD78_06670 [Candidatus Rokuibacteriota bacterium]|nr:MAG: hypothetical protein DMD78_06670 [Candidatus Rokubacteria bacterium]